MRKSITSLFDRILPSNDADQDHDDRNHEQDMDKGIHSEPCDKSQEPEYDENRRDCSKHGVFLIKIDTACNGAI